MIEKSKMGVVEHPPKTMGSENSSVKTSFLDVMYFPVVRLDSGLSTRRGHHRRGVTVYQIGNADN
jgi:hypothetical protein